MPHRGRVVVGGGRRRATEAAGNAGVAKGGGTGRRHGTTRDGTRIEAIKPKFYAEPLIARLKSGDGCT